MQIWVPDTLAMGAKIKCEDKNCSISHHYYKLFKCTSIHSIHSFCAAISQIRHDLDVHIQWYITRSYGRIETVIGRTGRRTIQVENV